jgi:hypothetical protein
VCLAQAGDDEYEIFECLADGSVVWCARASGLQNTRSKLNALSWDTGKEYFAMHLSSREIVFPIDSSNVASELAAKRIFQIAYAEELSLARARLLRTLGYAVLSVVGNEAAKFLLTTLPFDNLGISLFVVGHSAPLQTRKEMVDWLRVNYPGARILALNPPNEHVPDADYNVEENRKETWVPLVWSTMSALQPT